jgi:Na+/proline symporter
LFILSGLFGASYAKNNLIFVSKYVGARNPQEARKSVLIPFSGYLIMPVIWMIPAFAAFTLVPELALGSNSSHPAEESYIAVCLRILPPGLLGLMVVCMLATTASSVGMTLNVNAGSISQNLYRPWRGNRAGPSELLFAGKLATLAIGLIVCGGSLALSVSSLTLFDVLLYIGAYIGTPVAIPLFLGLFVRGEAWWVPRATVIFAIIATLTIYHGLPALLSTWSFPGLVGEILGYFATHRFVATNLLIVPASMGFFIAMARRSKPLPPAAEARQITFFDRMNQPANAADTPSEDSTSQNRLIAWFLTGLALLLLALSLFADSLGNWGSIASCAIIPSLLAAWLLAGARRTLV